MSDALAEISANFIWLRPGWLIIIPLSMIWLGYLSTRQQQAGWHKHISRESLQHLQSKQLPKKYYRYFAIPLVLGSVALAGPAITTLPTGAASSSHATVLILDLSPSMLARDITPDRLTQAKYKAIDILRQHREGEISLIVYAADAYRVTPLTDDPQTIETLIPTLQPDIMPAPGSNTESAIALAVDSLRESGASSATILLITDGITDAAQVAIEATLLDEIRLSILGIGTEQGSTIPTESGVITDESGLPVIAKLNNRKLKQLANHHNGRYAMWTTDSTDTQHLLSQKPRHARIKRSSDNLSTDGIAQKHPARDRKLIKHRQFDRYQDLGYWLILPLLVCAAYAFRKHIVISIFPLLLLSPEAESIELGHIWQSLWLNQNQQAREHLELRNYDKAYQLFTRNDWKAVAAYHRGQYTEAVQLLATPVYAEDLYNRGNAQARSGHLQAALKSYTQALLLYGSTQSPGYHDTLHNINVVKNLIDQNNEQDTDNSSNNNSTSGNASNGEGDELKSTTVESDPDAQPTMTNSVSRVGGSTGPGQSLDQTSLDENNGANSAPHVSSVQDALPSDATVRRNTPPPDARQINSNNAGPTLTPKLIDSSSPVLSPYSEQWLRDLPQNPGGYLRRKFLYLYQTSDITNAYVTPDKESVRY